MRVSLIMSCGRVVPASILALVLVPMARAETTAEAVHRLQKQREGIKTLYLVTKTTVHKPKRTNETTAERWEKRYGDTVKMRRHSIGQQQFGPNDQQIESLTVRDGQYEWRETKGQKRHVVFRSQHRNQNELQEIKRAIAKDRARHRKGESVLGHPCIVFDFVSGNEASQSKATYWVSEEYGVVLKSEMTRPNGASTEMIASKMKVNEPLDDDLFTYEPDEDVRVIDAAKFGKVRPDLKKRGRSFHNPRRVKPLKRKSKNNSKEKP